MKNVQKNWTKNTCANSTCINSNNKYGINVIGIIYNINNKSSITHKNNLIKNCHDELINLMSLYNLTKNTNKIEIVIFEIKKRWKTIISRGLNKDNKLYFKNLLGKMILSKYINKREKNLLNSFLHI